MSIFSTLVDVPAINYLVKLDDHEIFQDLLKIGDDTFNRAVDQKTDFYKDWMKRELQEHKYRIRNLPWWVRLFKRF